MSSTSNYGLLIVADRISPTYPNIGTFVLDKLAYGKAEQSSFGVQDLFLKYKSGILWISPAATGKI